MNPSISGVPKVIYSLWLQGKDPAPPLVRLNFARWAALNPDYQSHILDRTDVDAPLAGVELPLAQMTFQALSNVAHPPAPRRRRRPGRRVAVPGEAVR
jgi:hypothetical protein